MDGGVLVYWAAADERFCRFVLLYGILPSRLPVLGRAAYDNETVSGFVPRDLAREGEKTVFPVHTARSVHNDKDFISIAFIEIIGIHGKGLSGKSFGPEAESVELLITLVPARPPGHIREKQITVVTVDILPKIFPVVNPREYLLPAAFRVGVTGLVETEITIWGNRV